MTENANLALNLDATAARVPDTVALVLDGRTITYAEFAQAVRAVAGWMRSRGVGVGDRVALMLPNVPQFAIIYYAAMRLGAVVVPMNPLFKEREIRYYLEDSGASMLWCFPSDEAQRAVEGTAAELVPVDPAGLSGQLGELVDEVAHREAADTAVILYTSGTTGRPKGAELTYANLQTNSALVIDTLLHLESDDVIMGCLPLFHVFGMTCGLNTAVASGSTLTLLPRFDPVKALEIIERDEVTIFLGVPTMYGAMLNSAAELDPKPDLSRLRLAVSGGASLPVELLRRFESDFDCTLLEGYGLSETSPVASFNHPDGIRKAGSIGTPVRGVEMKLANPDGNDVPDGEIGEIWIRGEGLMKGYWNRPDATADAITPEGWFRSGDLARRDEDGLYYIVDRQKDMIVRGGMNVYPREIEEVLYEHPAVAEVAVVGRPDERLGEEIAAHVVLREGAQVTAQELIAFVKEQVAPYKYPREVMLLDALPKGATGKILKRELRRS